jgi:hypothetical protein
MVMDLVGQEAMPGGMLDLFEPAGFRLYTRLCRLTRTGQTGSQHSHPDRLQVVCANRTDGEVIFDLLDRAFDRYAEQLPVLSEIEAAIESRQILTIRHDGQLAALLFYETKGFTSTVRYWLVAEQFRSRRFGSALMRYYFASQSAVRRFILWVVANNENAVQKYRHYGYAPDGLVDHIFVNEMIRP